MTRKELASRRDRIRRRGETKSPRRAGFARGVDIITSEGRNQTFDDVIGTASLRVGTFDIFGR